MAVITLQQEPKKFFKICSLFYAFKILSMFYLILSSDNMYCPVLSWILIMRNEQ